MLRAYATFMPILSATLTTLTTLQHFKGCDGAVRVVKGGTLLPSWGCDGAVMRLEGGGGAVLSAVPSCDLSLFCPYIEAPHSTGRTPIKMRRQLAGIA